MISLRRLFSSVICPGLLATVLLASLAAPAAAIDADVGAVVGTEGKSQLQFDEPTGVAIDSDGNIHIADSGNARIQVLSTKGAFVRFYGNTMAPKLKEPYGIAIDRADQIFVTDMGVGRVFVYKKDGSVQTEQTYG